MLDTFARMKPMAFALDSRRVVLMNKDKEMEEDEEIADDDDEGEEEEDEDW
jgi:hypothetical protein